MSFDISKLKRTQTGSSASGDGDTIAAERLKNFISRVERLEDDKQAVAEDIKEVYAEAKSEGYDVKILKIVVKLRKMDEADRQEMDALTELYMKAIGEI